MPLPIEPSPVGDAYQNAIAFALSTFRRDRRAWSEASYLARLFGVCALALENDGTESEAVAALLCRAIDRRKAVENLADIRHTFGDEVADIVEACSDTFEFVSEVKKSLYDSTLATIERLHVHSEHIAIDASAGDGVLFIRAASVFYGARDTHERLARGENVFATFPGKKFGTLWKYRALADAFHELAGHHADARHVRFADRIVEIVDAMAGKPVTTEELRAAFAIDDTVDPREKGTLCLPRVGA